ncbi:MAG: hypothetical protein MK101_05435 [Phycisphaerales bacterium]|nr:hypothetical protein [Phycisphaerales bacterium]
MKKCGFRCCVFLLLARVVLGSGLFFVGWHQVTGEVELPTQDVKLLEGDPAVSTEPSTAGEDGDKQVKAEAVLKRSGVTESALHLYKAGVDEGALVLAWILALLALIGGALLVVGLLTRVWALGSAIVLGTMLWALSIEGGAMFDQSPFLWAANTPSFALLYMQMLGIIVGLGLLGSGPGRISLDHLLFARTEHEGGSPASDDEVH